MPGFSTRMKIFLSYSSAHRDTAASINYELTASGHDVFFDKEDLPPAQSYNERIRSAIETSDLFIFLITPESVTQGHYTLTELKIASRKWPNPAGHVLPVMLEATPYADIPAFLKAVTILTPEGNVSAEILIEVTDLAAAQPAKTKRLESDNFEIASCSYRPVEIRFGQGGAGSYPVAITASPVGNLAAQPCPLDAEALANQLWSSGVAIEGAARRGTTGVGADAPVLLPSEDAARRVGGILYKSLFSAQAQAFLQGSLRSVDPQRGEGLRFLINTTDAPDLARLPWEFLYNPDQDDFLFSDRMKPVIRWLDVDQPPPKLVIAPPLRLLMALASPQDRPELNVGAELAHLDDALRDLVERGHVTTTRLEHTTLEKLDDALLTHKPHMLHFIGHGDFVDNDGVILLEAENNGAADPITGRRLAVLLRNYLDSLRFVFLNSCLGAAVSLRDPFGGVAQNLIRRGIPAVIAMQFPIPDRVAVTLARHFYRYLAAGLPVDAALTSARAFLFARGYPVEWGAPALHMRTPDGRLFEIGNAERPAQPAQITPPSAPAVTSLETPTGAAPASQPKAVPSGRRFRIVIGVFLAIAALATALVWYSANPPELPSNGANPAISPAPVQPLPHINAERLYREALRALNAGETQAALNELAKAKTMDASGAALAAVPELREELFEKLLGSTQKALRDGKPTLAGKTAGALMTIDKPRASRELRKIFPTAGVEPMPARGESYRVQAGDTLWAIAGATYGDPTQWPRLYNANRDRIKNPDWIYPHQELFVPARSAAQAPRRYRVKSGDTLSAIAGAMYGDPLLWHRIYEANHDRIKNPDWIAPDQELMIPPGDRSAK
ncbi:MAG: CHAT domain-containing protein [Chloroflexota bacterium]